MTGHKYVGDICFTTQPTRCARPVPRSNLIRTAVVAAISRPGTIGATLLPRRKSRSSSVGCVRVDKMDERARDVGVVKNETYA